MFVILKTRSHAMKALFLFYMKAFVICLTHTRSHSTVIFVYFVSTAWHWYSFAAKNVLAFFTSMNILSWCRKRFVGSLNKKCSDLSILVMTQHEITNGCALFTKLFLFYLTDACDIAWNYNSMIQFDPITKLQFECNEMCFT